MVPHEVACKCCGGTGVQVNREGLRVHCPECGGSGKTLAPVTPGKIVW